MADKLLIVEDNESFQNSIKKALLSLGLEILVASNASEALDTLAKNQVKLVILDLGLPDRSGFDVIAEMQSMENCADVPVIFVTGSDGVSEKVTAFSLGAEDYIIKPFNSIELKARVQSKLTKAKIKSSKKEILTSGDLTVNLLSHQVVLQSEGQGKEVVLTPLEYKLIVHFLTRPEMVFSRDQLIDKVWGSGVNVSDRTVDFHIHGLRKKLGAYGKCVEAIPGEGYRFTPANKNKTPSQKAA